MNRELDNSDNELSNLFFKPDKIENKIFKKGIDKYKVIGYYIYTR